MHLSIEPQDTCALTWLKATQRINEIEGYSAHNVIMSVSQPLKESPKDTSVLELVDCFLRGNSRRMTIQTVANTIFPANLYARYGRPQFYKEYKDRIGPKLNSVGSWGQYFMRMIDYKSSDGETINQLDELVNRIIWSLEPQNQKYRSVYELVLEEPLAGVALYDPKSDLRRLRNRQCLSFLSFKIDIQSRLVLTALYRNHYYIERLLGNLIGLARLMEFISKEAGIEVGPLTVVSTHATVDRPKGHSRKDIRQLLIDCNAIY